MLKVSRNGLQSSFKEISRKVCESNIKDQYSSSGSFWTDRFGDLRVAGAVPGVVAEGDPLGAQVLQQLREVVRKLRQIVVVRLKSPEMELNVRRISSGQIRFGFGSDLKAIICSLQHKMPQIPADLCSLLSLNSFMSMAVSWLCDRVRDSRLT
jgi:hypothetical protein